jgi:hypothetical protein
MTELKTEVDDCKKIIKFLEAEIGCKNDIISKVRLSINGVILD